MDLRFQVILLTIVFFGLCTTSPEYDYKEVLKLSLLFYEAQRSGKLPTTNRVHWRGDSALDDKGNDGEDLVGGYYDANDMVKFGFTMAFSMTILSWGLPVYSDAYRSVDQYNQTLETIKWGIDYFKKCHVGPYEFYAQVGSFKLDHQFWGRPEDLNMSRPAFKIDKQHPASDVAAEVSATFASSSLIFKEFDEEYSRDLLRRSKELFEFSKKYRGFYNDTVPESNNEYENLEYEDEIAWAATWLFKATREKRYEKLAENYLKQNLHSLNSSYSFWYNSKLPGILVLMAQEPGKKQLQEALEQYCYDVINKVKRTPKGLVYLSKQGTLSHSAYLVFVCLQALEVKDLQKYRQTYLDFAKQQLDYMLGSTGMSYVIGYGKVYPQKPFHAPSSCPDRPAPCGKTQLIAPGPNPQILYGALVSGPHDNDYYQDRRDENLFNEVTLDFNSGFQNALAGLIHHLSNKLA